MKKPLTFAIVAALAATLAGHAARAVPAPLYPLAAMSLQAPQPDPTSGTGAAIAFASTAGASHVERISFIAAAPLAADSLNYMTLNVIEIDASGSRVGSPLWTATTQPVVDGGTGDWTERSAALGVTLALDLPAGHSLLGVWSQSGAGVAHPGGYWRIE